MKTSNKIHDLTDVLYERLNKSKNENHSQALTDLGKTIVQLKDLLTNYPGETTKKQDLQVLANMVFITQNKELLELPYLGFLANELTTEGNSQYKAQPKIYQTLFKQYKKTLNNFVGSDVLKNLHDKEVIKFDEIFNSFYMPLSREKIENINVNFKNKYSSESITRLLMLYSK